VSATYPLYTRSANPTIQQARKSQEATQADLAAAEQDLIIRVAQAYFDVLGAQDTLATTRGNKAAITEQLASAKRNFEVGTATITDTREAQARYDLAVAQEIGAENDLTTKKIALDQLVGKTGVSPRPLAVPVTLPGIVPADAQAWVDVADQVQPSVRKARLALDIAELDTTIAKAAETPTVNLVGSYGVDHSTGSLSTSVPGLTRSGSIGVQLTLPLYTGGSAQNRVRETKVLEEKSRQDLEAARRGVALATRQAYYALQSGVAQVKALEAAEGSSKLALEATQLGYKVGVRVNLDVLNAQSQLYQTESDLAKARYNVILGDLRLRQASGQLKPDDVRAVNALLAP
jgi:outer membrane protein